jgi:CRISPR-associated protein Csm4
MPIYHLTMRGPLHQGEFIGIHRENILDRIPSDSLCAAIVAAWKKTGADIRARLSALEAKTEPPFRVTSGFPLAGDVRFYPAPQTWPAHAGFPPGDKTARRMRWISDGVLKQLQNGATPSMVDEVFIHGKTTWFTQEESLRLQPLFVLDAHGQPCLWGQQVTPRVTVDRVSSASNLFFTGRTSYARDCGVWFGVRGDSTWVKESLEILKADGLGGLRSTGHGSFEWASLADELPEVTSDNWGYSLSRFAPKDAQEAAALRNEHSSYALEVVGGWYKDDGGHAWRRRSVRLVAEGALLPAGGLQGKAIDVRPDVKEAPDWPVWRTAFAFFIPAQKLVDAP